jgi:hypothetical protein
VSRQPLAGMAGAVCAGVAVTALVSAAHAAGGFLARANGSDWTGLLGAGTAIRVIAFVATVIILVVWLHRARVNLVRMPYTRARWAPGWAVGALVVPVLGPFIFAAVLAEVARESASPADAAAGRRLAAVAWTWFAAAVPAAVLFAVAPAVPDPAAIVVRAGAEGFQLAAAVLLIEVVRAVTWWQDGTRPRPWVPAPRQPLPGDATMRA